MNQELKTLTLDEQNLLIKLYGNRMEQAMNRNERDDAQVWMDAMYEEIKKRNQAIWEVNNLGPRASLAGYW